MEEKKVEAAPPTVEWERDFDRDFCTSEQNPRFLAPPQSVKTFIRQTITEEREKALDEAFFGESGRSRKAIHHCKSCKRIWSSMDICPCALDEVREEGAAAERQRVIAKVHRILEDIRLGDFVNDHDEVTWNAALKTIKDRITKEIE